MRKIVAMLPALALAGPVASAEEPRIDVPEAAAPAVAAVDRFRAALAAGDLEAAARELDPSLIVLESGGAERSAAEYLAEHAPADARFLQDARQALLRRSARVEGSLAWIASEGELRFQRDGEPVVHASAETMVLQERPGGWKIVHIHWSSRTLEPTHGRGSRP